MPKNRAEHKKEIQLSKSEYMMFLKHPAWLWLKKHDSAKLPEPDDNLQAIFDAGLEFEYYANQRFPDGKPVGFSSYPEYLTMPSRTKRFVDEGVKTILQGRFESKNITCICDVVDRVIDETFDLYEIKSSTKVKKEHYYDLAFQVVVLESAGLNVRKISVIHVNGDYVRQGEVDPLVLTVEEDITSEARDLIEETQSNIVKAFEVINSSTMPDPSPRHANFGSLNEWMDIFTGLAEVDRFSIYNLVAPGANRLRQLEDLGVTHIKDIPDGFALTTKQLAQVVATKKDERLINKEKIQEFVSKVEYPLYFLDYETAMGIVPPYDGTRPYQQIPFQYSLHIINGKNEVEVHKEYLHRDISNPIPALLESLRKEIGPKGSILVWYKSFEMGRNKEMGEMFPKYASFLEDLNSRVIDLIDPFANGWVVDKEFLGSASIKAVLPVLIPGLSYSELEIKEGASAQRLWMDEVLKQKGNINREDLFQSLVEYCKMDTLAMVKVWDFLCSI